MAQQSSSDPISKGNYTEFYTRRSRELLIAGRLNPPAIDGSSDPTLLRARRRTKHEYVEEEDDIMEDEVVDNDEDEEQEEEQIYPIRYVPQLDEDDIEDDGEEEDEEEDEEDVEEDVEDEEDEEEDVYELSSGEFEPHSSDDEFDFELKTEQEQDDIQAEIESLLQKMPELAEDYQLVDRLGTGTFSSVFKAIDLHYHSKWENGMWHGHHPPNTSAWYQSRPKSPDSPHYVAVKRIMVTSSPKRILNELAILETCRGCRHVSQIITSLRKEDQIVVIMPYQRSADFKDLYKSLSIRDIRRYFRCMFRALRDIHARGIIHRDLKPANFLYDPIHRLGTLVDFGLADTFVYGDEDDSGCNHTAPTTSHPHGVLKDLHKPTNSIERALKMSREHSALPEEYIGYPTDDPRPVARANRAGTRGFRAPEVLFKCTAQSPAIDVWSAGIVLLFFLCGKFPLFAATSDLHATMELAVILGKDAMEKTAALHNRTFSTNVPEINEQVSWSDFVHNLNPEFFLMDQIVTPQNDEERDELERQRLVNAAVNLLERCLNPFSIERITAREAMYHPFLALDEWERENIDNPDPVMLQEREDDELFPHPPGEGVCSNYHYYDSDEEEWKVLIGEDEEAEWFPITGGEGQAIGTQPCEFHSV